MEIWAIDHANDKILLKKWHLSNWNERFTSLRSHKDKNNYKRYVFLQASLIFFINLIGTYFEKYCEISC